ncbi:hypothetical protein L6V77_16835 [Myxococcota bacterium]|nr:hypothetical protein [Myxococcota bacterium]
MRRRRPHVPTPVVLACLAAAVAFAHGCGGGGDGGGAGGTGPDRDGGGGTGGQLRPDAASGGAVVRPDAGPTGGSGGTVVRPDAGPTGGSGGTVTPPDAGPTGGSGGAVGPPDAAPTGGSGGGVAPPDAAPTGGSGGVEPAPDQGVPVGGAEPPPDDVAAFCTDACPAFVACGAPADFEPPPDVVAACIEGCLTESTPAQRACVRALPAADCDGRAACLAPDAPPPPPPEVVDACDRACAVALACNGVDPEAPPADLTDACRAGCLSESDEAQRACVLDAAGDCEAVAGCFTAGQPGPDPAQLAACTAACATVVACQGADAPADLEDACVAGCLDTGTPAQLDCVAGAAGCEAVSDCFAGEAPPVDPALSAACETGCDAALACAGGEPGAPVPDDVRAACVDGCVTTSTPAQRACVAGAVGDCERLSACFADAGPAPDPALTLECERACGVLVACGGAGLGDDAAPPEIVDACVAGCTADSTPAQRTCVSNNDADCAAAQACFDGEMP